MVLTCGSVPYLWRIAASINALLRTSISLHRTFQPLSKFTVSNYPSCLSPPRIYPSLFPEFTPLSSQNLPLSPPRIYPSLSSPPPPPPPVMPTVTITPLGKVVNASDRAELACDAQGFPLPDVVWSREDTTGLQTQAGVIDIVERTLYTQAPIHTCIYIHSYLHTRIFPYSHTTFFHTCILSYTHTTFLV